LTRVSKIPEDQNSAEGFLKRVLGFTAEEDARLGINQCFEKYCMSRTDHASIFIDEADVMMGFNGWEELIRDLAHGSWEDKKFNVMLSCCNPENVKNIIELNGRTKITLIGRIPQLSRWTEEEIRMYVLSQDESSELSEAQCDRLIQVGTRAGSPEIIKSILLSGSKYLYDAVHDETAAWWDKLWTNGSEVISRLDLLY
jgi:hypothetical protein